MFGPSLYQTITPDGPSVLCNILKILSLDRLLQELLQLQPYKSCLALRSLLQNLKLKPLSSRLDRSRPHFGVNLSLKEFHRLTSHILASGYKGVLGNPKVVDEGSPMERRKIYVKCPTGYIFEINQRVSMNTSKN